MEVHAWLTKAGNPETANQLKTMLSTLEKEAEVNRKKLKNRQNLLDDLDKANAERRSTTSELEVISNSVINPCVPDFWQLSQYDQELLRTVQSQCRKV